MRVALAIAVLSVLLVGCREGLSPGDTVESGGALTSEAVKYVHDTKHGVGCWFYVSESNTSISCLPDSSYTVAP